MKRGKDREKEHSYTNKMVVTKTNYYYVQDYQGNNLFTYPSFGFRASMLKKFIHTHDVSSKLSCVRMWKKKKRGGRGEATRVRLSVPVLVRMITSKNRGGSRAEGRLVDCLYSYECFAFAVPFFSTSY